MIRIIKTLYRDFFLFLKKPVDNPNGNQTLRQKFLKLFLVLILDLVIVGLCALLLSFLEKQRLFSTENHKTIELLKSMPKSAVIIAFIIVVPLIEELIFRLHLRYKNNYLLRFFISSFYLFGKKRKQLIEERIKKMWYKRFGYIYYFSAILFGFVHVFNFDTDKDLLLLFPLVTAPQIFVGIFAGYLRVRFNLILGYCLHALHNMIFFLPFLLAGDRVELLKTDTEEYSILIEEVFRSDQKQIAKYFPDSIVLKKFKLNDLIGYTRNTEAWLIDGNNREKMNKVLNIQYKNKVDSTSVNRQLIEKKIADLYKFRIHKENKLVHVWALSVVDSLKLNQYKTDSKKKNFMSFSADSATIHGVQLFGIAYAIQSSKKKKIFLKESIPGKFDIRLNTKDTINLRIQLDSIYGLKLGDSLATIEYLNIDFKNED